MTRAKLKVWSYAGLGLFLSLSVGEKAHAFCRTTTSQEQPESCADVCITDGYPFAWQDPDLRYVFNKRGFPGLTDPVLRQVFATAFGQWESVRCETGEIGLSIKAEPGTTPLTVRPKEQDFDTNVIGHLTDPEWAQADFDPFAFALTSVRYDNRTGRLLGADMWFNGGMGAFGVCPDAGCRLTDTIVDLPNVATHEAGHFLGLAHTNVKGATMACDASPTDIDKRSLELDDRKGLCAVYPPSEAFTGTYQRGLWTREPRKSASCSVGPTADAQRRTPLFGFATTITAVTALWLWRRRAKAS